MRLNNKVAVITGAGNGLGAAYAKGLAAEGAAVVLADIDGDAAERGASDIDASGGRALAVRTDVADESSVLAMTAAAVTRFGGIDILINNAAVMFRFLNTPRTPFWRFTSDEFDLVMRVNVLGSWLCAKAVYPYLVARGRGRIINVSSNMAFGTDLPWPAGMAPYTASKAAVIGLTRALAGELGKDRITVNAVAPGVVATESVEAHVGMHRIAASAEQQALKRIANVNDILGVVLFLCSTDSDWVTGQTIVADGGLMC